MSHRVHNVTHSSNPGQWSCLLRHRFNYNVPTPIVLIQNLKKVVPCKKYNKHQHCLPFPRLCNGAFNTNQLHHLDAYNTSL